MNLFGGIVFGIVIAFLAFLLVRDCLLWKECPYCGGEGCAMCKYKGWVSRKEG